MGRAEELFGIIVTAGVGAIDSLVDTRTSEDLYLDYKQIATKPSDRAIHADDKWNLKKAVSGFANTAGGIIVWGVKCKPGSDGSDVPTDKLPSRDAVHLRSLFDGVISGLTIPAHSGVNSHVILTGKDDREGYVVTLVPAADNMPLQLTDGSYYMRAGSSFATISNPILAAMFGRRPQPVLEIDLEISKEAAQPSQPGQKMSVSCYVVIRNRGVGIAEGMYATVEVTKPDYSAVWVQGAKDPRFEEPNDFAGMTSIMGHKDRRLAPGASTRTLLISLELEEMIAKDLWIRISAGTSNGPPAHREFHVPESKLNHTLQCFRSPAASRSWLTKRIFGLVSD